MSQPITISLFIRKEQEGTYFTQPFHLPEGMESFTLTYRYPRSTGEITGVPGGAFTNRQSVNTIDLGLIAPDGTQVGASGSDKNEITISAAWDYTRLPDLRACPGECRYWWCIQGRT